MTMDSEGPATAAAETMGDSTATPDPAAPRPIRTGAEYIESLRGRNLKVYLFGALVPEPVDHPMIRPSINAVAKTYDLANENPALASADSSLSGGRVNRFLHVTESVDDVVMQNRMQRKLGQLTGTCFQRCVGMDAINSLYSVTYEIDQKHGTPYHARFKAFVREMQERNYVIGGAMTDPKGDRSKGPSEQEDPDLFVHVAERRGDGLVIRGAKAHQTGCINSHWILVMPTMRLKPEDADYAVVWQPPADMLRGRTDLRAVFNLGAGVDAILGLRAQSPDAIPEGLPIVRLDDAGMAAQMGEYVTHAVLRFFRRLDEYERQQQAKMWRFLKPFNRDEFVVGVLGLGVLGTHIAKTLAGFGFPVRGWSRSAKSIEGIDCRARSRCILPKG